MGVESKERMQELQAQLQDIEAKIQDAQNSARM